MNLTNLIDRLLVLHEELEEIAPNELKKDLHVIINDTDTKESIDVKSNFGDEILTIY